MDRLTVVSKECLSSAEKYLATFGLAWVFSRKKETHTVDFIGKKIDGSDVEWLEVSTSTICSHIGCLVCSAERPRDGDKPHLPQYLQFLRVCGHFHS